MSTKQTTIILAYIPVLHQGYWQFLSKHQTADQLLLIPSTLVTKVVPQIDYLHKDIRALEVKQIKQALEAWQIGPKIEILTLAKLEKLQKHSKLCLIAPDEDITRQLIKQFLPQAQISWDRIFLRWDKHKVLKHQDINTDATISASQFDQTIMQLAKDSSRHSSDWWRQVGAVIIDTQGEIISAGANRHQPSDQTPYVLGDTRGLFHKGQHIELSTAAHAESSLIAQSAKLGLTLQGASLYVTDFPCPYCARMIVLSGIKKLYYQTSYAVMDGQNLLKQAGIKIIQVKCEH